MKKKIIIMGLALTLLLAGCGKGDVTEVGEKVPNVITKEAVTVEVEKKPEIVIDYSLEPNEMGKKTIMKWIYDLKSNQPSATKLSFDKLVEEASNGTCMPVILGCTELPVIKEVIGAEGVFIDPTSILAKKCVQFSKSELKGCFDEATEKGK